MEGFGLLVLLPLLGLTAFGCIYFWRLINHGSTGGRIAGWLFFTPSILLTLFLLLMVESILNPPKRDVESVEPESHTIPERR